MYTQANLEELWKFDTEQKNQMFSKLWIIKFKLNKCVNLQIKQMFND